MQEKMFSTFHLKLHPNEKRLVEQIMVCRREEELVTHVIAITQDGHLARH